MDEYIINCNYNRHLNLQWSFIGTMNIFKINLYTFNII